MELTKVAIRCTYAILGHSYFLCANLFKHPTNEQIQEEDLSMSSSC